MSHTDRRDRVESPARDRRTFLVLGWSILILAVLHLVDHALRGERVHDHGLNPSWDHSGWPFKTAVTPYTYSLVLVLAILVVGLWGTYAGRLRAGYWLGAAVVLGALVTYVHFVPTAQQETPGIIFRSWMGLPAVGVAAVAVTFAIVVMLLILMLTAIRIGRRTGRW
jgi:hypothetical protein